MTPAFVLRVFSLVALCIIILSGTGWAVEGGGESTSSESADQRGSWVSYLNASGSIRTDYFRSSKTLDNNTDFYGATAQLKLLPVFNEVFDGKVEARFLNPDITHDDRAPSTATLLEGYVTMHFPRADLRIGKQNVPWGRADAINPTDNLTPRNYLLLLPFEEDQRFGTTALKLDYYLTPEYTVSFFTTPLFEPSRIPLPIPAGALVENNKPARTFSNSEIGIKLNKTSRETDWSLSYFHGFSLIPEVRFKGFVPPASLLLEKRYAEIDVAGADAARNYGRYGFRAEAAYIWPHNYSSQEPTTIQPYLYYVLGVDRTFLENLNLNLQFVGRRIQDFHDPQMIGDPIQRALAVENAILFGQLHRSTYGLTSRISKRWFHDTLETEFLVAVNFNPTNAYLRPLITYAFTDRIKGTLGAEIYSGTEESFFGILNRNQGAFAEVRYNF